MPYNPLTGGENVPLSYSPAGSDFATQEVGPIVTTGSFQSAPQVPWIATSPVGNSATAAAAAACVATLPGAVGKTTYIMGFVISTAAPAAAVTGTATVTGLLAAIGTLNFQVVESVTLGAELVVEFPFPLPASAQNTPIVVTLPAITSGAVSAVSAWGFQR